VLILNLLTLAHHAIVRSYSCFAKDVHSELESSRSSGVPWVLLGTPGFPLPLLLPVPNDGLSRSPSPLLGLFGLDRLASSFFSSFFSLIGLAPPLSRPSSRGQDQLCVRREGLAAQRG
jgi:hypothetical protein